MKPYHLLVIDWDGTFFDSKAIIGAVLNAIVDEVGLDLLPPEGVRDVIGLALPEAVAELSSSFDPDTHRHIVQRFRYYSPYSDSPSSSPFPGTQTTLEQLRQTGYLSCLATSKSRGGLD